MTTEPTPKVEIVSEPGVKNQWGKGMLYSRDGKKFTIKMKEAMWGGLFGFVVLSLFLLIQGDPEVAKQAQPNIDSPDLNSVSNQLQNIPGIGDGAPLSTSNGSTLKRSVRFLGPQLSVNQSSQKIPPGSTVKAVLLTTGTDGLIRAKSVEPMVSYGETKFDEGTIFLGTGTSSDDRLKINFRQMVFQDGTFQNVEAEAFDDSDQMLGLKGEKIKSEGLKLGAAIGLNFAGGLSEGLQDSDVQGGVEVKKSNLKNAMLNGAATAALDQSREMMSDFKNQHNNVSVPAGKTLIITFEGN